jgi:hypothetical protein
MSGLVGISIYGLPSDKEIVLAHVDVLLQEKLDDYLSSIQKNGNLMFLVTGHPVIQWSLYD